MTKSIDEEWLKRQVLDGGTQKEIAEKIGCSQACISKRCKRMELAPISHASKYRKDLVGKTIGLLTVLEYKYTLQKTPFWLCRCNCGVEKVINGKHLKNGFINSCGCLRTRPSPRRTGYKDLPGCYVWDLRSKATKRGLEFSITEKEMWALYSAQEGKCALTGEQIDFPKNQHRKYRSLQTASLDRIDSSIGYVVGNIQWVHKHINLMKQDLLNEEFIEWCRKVVKNEKF